jgi:hypothetical protein
MAKKKQSKRTTQRPIESETPPSRSTSGGAGHQTNDPQHSGREGQTETRRDVPPPRYDDRPASHPNADEHANPSQPGLPQYDDRRNRTDRAGAESPGRTDLPDYGDTEPGDPRRLRVTDED